MLGFTGVKSHTNHGVLYALFGSSSKSECCAKAAVSQEEIWVDIESLPVSSKAIIQLPEQGPKHHAKSPERVFIMPVEADRLTCLLQRLIFQFLRIPRKRHVDKVEVCDSNELVAFGACEIDLCNPAPDFSRFRYALLRCNIHLLPAALGQLPSV